MTEICGHQGRPRLPEGEESLTYIQCLALLTGEVALDGQWPWWSRVGADDLVGNSMCVLRSITDSLYEES